MNFPNLLTLIRIVLSPVFMIFMQFQHYYWRLAATVVFIIAALTDLADGYYARRMGHLTGFGRFMDPLADKILVSTAFLTFVPLGYARGWMVIVIVVREFLITDLRSMAAYRGMIISSSFLAKWKTATQMIAIAVIMIFANIEPLLRGNAREGTIMPAWSVPAFGWSYNLFDVLIFIPLILTVWTGVDYLIKSGGMLKGMLR